MLRLYCPQQHILDTKGCCGLRRMLEAMVHFEKQWRHLGKRTIRMGRL
jgi:hypothetical protein